MLSKALHEHKQIRHSIWEKGGAHTTYGFLSVMRLSMSMLLNGSGQNRKCARAAAQNALLV